MLYIITLILFFIYFVIFSALEKPNSLIANQMEMNSDLMQINSTVTIDNLPVIEESIHQDCANPVRVTSLSVDCISLCNQSQAIPYVVAPHSTFIWNNKEYGEGTYCLLASPIECNPHTTQLVNDESGFRCSLLFLEFQGPVGTDINVCNGTLYDAMANTHYVGKIPHNLVLSGPEEIYNGTYRFHCKEELSPLTQNALIGLPSNHLIRYENPCTEGIPNPIKIKYDLGLDRCYCVEPLVLDNGKCTSCRSGTGRREFLGLKKAHASSLTCQDYNLPYVKIEHIKCRDANCFYISLGEQLDGGPLFMEIVEENTNFYKKPHFHHDLFHQENKLMHEAIFYSRKFKNPGHKNLMEVSRQIKTSHRKNLLAPFHIWKLDQTKYHKNVKRKPAKKLLTLEELENSKVSEGPKITEIIEPKNQESTSQESTSQIVQEKTEEPNVQESTSPIVQNNPSPIPLESKNEIVQEETKEPNVPE